MAGSFGQLDARGFAQAQGLGGFIYRIGAECVAQNIVEIVAGNTEGFAGIDFTVGAEAAGVAQTLRGKVFVLVVNAFVQDLILGCDPSGVDAGHHHGHFVGRAGRILALQSPIVQGVVIFLNDLGKILPQGGRVIGGIAGAHQHLARGRLHDHHGSALGVVAVAVSAASKGQDLGFQCLFGHHLKLDVDGHLHIITGNGLLSVIGADDRAVGGHFVHANTVGGVEIVFKGQLKTGLTHHCVHGVAQFLVGDPLFGIHGAHIAQNMGCVMGVVLPDGGGFHVHARGVQLQNNGQIFFAGVGDEDIVGKGGQVTQGQLIPDAQHQTGILVRPLIGDLVALAKHVDEQGRGNIRVQIAPIGQEFLEITLP